MEEMVYHLITWGSAVTVVKPDALRARLAEFALQALQQHQKESD
jgi:predicted DNA-binding transcriptional regulator YafY